MAKAIPEFVLLHTEGHIDLFRRGNAFYWQHEEYREDDGTFCEPCNGPYQSINAALKDAAIYGQGE